MQRTTTMYTTRPLSLYWKDPDLLSVPPSDGPNSGYLVIQDEESIPTACFGLVTDKSVQDLPFPQNRLLEFTHGTDKDRRHYPVYLIPVINQPLSSSTYYAIKPKGSHRGEVYACSREEDVTACCFCNHIRDVKPRPFNPADIYQHFYFSTKKTWSTMHFSAASVASDGFPPWFLWSTTRTIRTQRPKHVSLGEAAGLDLRLRTQLPDFSFPSSQQTSRAPVVVGKWYCPFMFVRDMTLKDQVKKSMFYEMTLEQTWERIFECEGDNVVTVDTIVPTESVRVGGESCKRDYEGGYGENENMVLFKSVEGGRGKPSSGLSSLIYERMIWEEERVGWVTNEDQQMKVVRKEECDRKLSSWARFSSYMLVERFVLKRSDGSIVLTYDFNHTHQIRSKWD